MDLDNKGSPGTTLDSRATEQEIREVRAMLAALLFAPPEAKTDAAAHSMKLSEAAIDAALADLAQADGEDNARTAAEGGMVRVERRPFEPQTFEISGSRDSDIEALLESPVRMESSYGRFQVFEVSTSEEPHQARSAINVECARTIDDFDVEFPGSTGKPTAIEAGESEQEADDASAAPVESGDDRISSSLQEVVEPNSALPTSAKSASAALLAVLLALIFKRPHRGVEREARKQERAALGLERLHVSS
jgi:hypothetical protein